MIEPGDVFTRKTPDDRFAALRIIQVDGKSSLVCTTPYIDERPPKIDDPLLSETIEECRFFYTGKPARYWVDGQPTSLFEYLGNIPPTPSEASLSCRTYSGGWNDSTGQESFLEWRWTHEREAFKAEIRQRDEQIAEQRRQPQKPKKMIDEDEFWSIIELLDWQHEGDDERVLMPAVNALAKKSKLKICRFEERLAWLLYQLDTKDHASNIGEFSYDKETDYISADGFLYARCAVIANGKAVYDAALKSPKKMLQDLEFESLLSLPRDAYEMRTGEEFNYSTGCSYETFSNPVGWGRTQ